jgi:DNA end-binding protein Ku
LPERAHGDERQEAPARAFWSGTITFGLVSIPVDFFAAVQGRRTSMKLVDAKGNPLGRQYYSEEDENLTQDELVRGYETDEGEMIVVTDEELESVAPEMTRDIELRRFVPREQIAPAYFQRPYILAPAGSSQKAYQLLARTMQKTGRVGIGTFVMRGHQYLVAILSDGRLLRAETLRFAAELRSPQDLGLPKRAKPSRKEVKRFSDAIAALTREALDMEELSDRYAEALQKLAEEKAKKGKDVVEPAGAPEEEEEGGGQVIDLMKVLKERIGRARPAPAQRASRSNAQGGSDLERLSKADLYKRASRLRIAGRSKMEKAELIEAVRKAG